MKISEIRKACKACEKAGDEKYIKVSFNKDFIYDDDDTPQLVITTFLFFVIEKIEPVLKELGYSWDGPRLNNGNPDPENVGTRHEGWYKYDCWVKD